MVRSQRLYIALLASLVCQQAAAETALLEFSSPGCGPCRLMRPAMRQLKAAGYPIRDIDSSREPGASEARKYGVTDLPTFVVVVDGQERKRLVGGGHPPAALAQLFNGAIDQAV